MKNREIGGYIEFEHYQGNMLHEDGIKLDSGRNCLAYLIKAKGIKQIVMPSFLCESIFEVCEKYGVKIRYYEIGADFHPVRIRTEADEFLYLMNYYGQLLPNDIIYYKNTHNNVIVDNTHDYFTNAMEGVDTFYSCRKYFGVPDGAIVYSDKTLSETLEQSKSHEYMGHLLGRFEENATDYYQKSVENNNRFRNKPIRKMSKLTENILRSIDYESVFQKRISNFQYLNSKLQDINKLTIRNTSGTFMYPLMVNNGKEMRKKLQQNGIYIPMLWPNVAKETTLKDLGMEMAENILPLPIDQRYGTEDMKEVVEAILRLL